MVLKTQHPYLSALELISLAAIWGASFLFMRVGVPEFGVIAFTALRTAIAAIFLYLCLVKFQQVATLTQHWQKIFFVGIINTAIPFALFSYATLTLSAGTTSVLNATTPMFGAIVAYIWLKDKLSVSAFFGVIIGFFGVYLLVSEDIAASSSAMDTTVNNTLISALAAMLAALCYGISANYTKKYLTGIKPLTLAAGSQISATIILLPISLFFMPTRIPSFEAISSLVLLGIVCTGIAYIIFFRLISQLGPARTISVTYLIPAFGILWGSLFLDEKVSLTMLIGGVVILLGVALTTGIIKSSNKPR